MSSNKPQKLQEEVSRTRKIDLSIFALLKFLSCAKRRNFNVDFLDPERVKATEEKVGKIVCDIHAPEGCENCSG